MGRVVTKAVKKSAKAVELERIDKARDARIAAKKAPPVKKEKAPAADVVRKVEELAKANAATRKAATKYNEAKAVEDALRQDIVALFGKKKIDGFRHKLGTVSIYTSEFVIVDDLDAVKKYAKLKGNSDILTVGLSAAAYKARIADGKEVPGAHIGTREDLRFTPTKK